MTLALGTGCVTQAALVASSVPLRGRSVTARVLIVAAPRCDPKHLLCPGISLLKWNRAPYESFWNGFPNLQGRQHGSVMTHPREVLGCGGHLDNSYQVPTMCQVPPGHLHLHYLRWSLITLRSSDYLHLCVCLNKTFSEVLHGGSGARPPVRSQCCRLLANDTG